MNLKKGDDIIEFGKSIISNGVLIVNPTLNDYVQGGWVVYTIPETLDGVKRNKISEITNYYNSDDINLVNIQGTDMYIDPDTRYKISERIARDKYKSKTTDKFELGGIALEIPIATAEAMLYAVIDQYAVAHDIMTSKVKEVNALTTIADVKAYDAKSGYPTKLSI